MLLTPDLDRPPLWNVSLMSWVYWQIVSVFKSRGWGTRCKRWSRATYLHILSYLFLIFFWGTCTHIWLEKILIKMDKSVFEMNVWINGSRRKEWNSQEFAMRERMWVRLTASSAGRMGVLCTLKLRQHKLGYYLASLHAIRDWLSRLGKLFMIFRSSCKKMPEYCVKLDRFLPHPCQLIIHCSCLNRYSDGLRAGRQRFDSLQGQEIFPILQRPDRLWAPHGLLSNGHREFFPELNRPEREADHTPPSSAEVEDGGAIPPLPNMSSWSDA
jgi:hypothetical protein